jgi:hypothetical protein
MTHFTPAVVTQQAAAEPKDTISGCSSALPGSIREKKARLYFPSSNRASVCCAVSLLISALA